jgi:hypothetical protein
VLDAAYDFAPLYHVADTFAETIAGIYQEAVGSNDPTFHHRIRRYRELRGSSVFSFWASVRESDAEELVDSIKKLRESLVLTT